MSDHEGSGFPAGGGIAAYLLVRALLGLTSESKLPAPAPAVTKRVIITPPPAAADATRVIITPPPAAADAVAPGVSPPVAHWTGDGELLAWRAWRLAILSHDDADRIGPRLVSLNAPCVWDGPAIRADRVPSAEEPGGIYATKMSLADVTTWQLSEHCWVTGWVALSGRVVEHHLGYRAERAVIRELRLGVATHLAVRPPDKVRELIGRLEERYQATVDPGDAEREIADRILASGFQPRFPEVPQMVLWGPWRLA